MSSLFPAGRLLFAGAVLLLLWALLLPSVPSPESPAEPTATALEEYVDVNDEAAHSERIWRTRPREIATEPDAIHRTQNLRQLAATLPETELPAMIAADCQAAAQFK